MNSTMEQRDTLQLSDLLRSISTPSHSGSSNESSRGRVRSRMRKTKVSPTKDDSFDGDGYLQFQNPDEVSIKEREDIGRLFTISGRCTTAALNRPSTSNVELFGPKLNPMTPDRTSSLPDTPLPSPEVDREEIGALSHVVNDTDSLRDERSLSSEPENASDMLFFRDGRRRIDMVLVYREEHEGVQTEIEARREEQRRVFELNMVKEGLQLELEPAESSFDGKTCFLKVHIPWKVKIQYAELMNIKLHTRKFISVSMKAWGDNESKHQPKKNAKFRNWLNRFQQWHLWDTLKYPTEPSFYAITEPEDPEECFVVKDKEATYTPAQRSLMVMQILVRTNFDEEQEKSGIRRLIADGSYQDCFPLHEGAYNKPAPDGKILDRHLLYLIWARPSQWYKKQPLWLIRRYFGDKVALYFAWLGYYTRCLYLPAIVGLLCFLYGIITLNGSDNIPSLEICDDKLAGNITLCPLCDKVCQYQKLGDSCLFSKMSYLFDNPSTVFYAIFMSCWATTFLELWKRRQATLQWEWELQNGDVNEETRPEFETTIKTFRINPVTREKEPYMPVWSRVGRYCVTGSMVLFMICVVIAAVLATIMYRLSFISVFYTSGDFLKTHAKIATWITAAIINLILIMILTRVYHRMALWMTNMENPRTQSEYESSYTFKIFLFEFVNFYSSLIYIAFFKGRFFVYPGEALQVGLHKIKSDVCDPAGCLFQVSVQLSIIMVGKQCFNNFMEILVPKFSNWWRKRVYKAATKDHGRPYTSWEEDYQLQDPGRLALFDEYLEMILQYGFVTLFVAAFPLAPLFALLNNIAEIRLDAYKMVKEARRPLAERTQDIGAWLGILKGVTYVAVVSNAFVIAYTSDFIPRSVYSIVYSPTHDLKGYIDHSLSDFNTSHYPENVVIDDPNPPPTCQYRGYRNGPDHIDSYGLSPQYWHVFAARLAFVVVFEHVVFSLTGLMAYIIPEVPRSIATQVKREKLIAQEAKYEKGLKGRDEDDELLSVLRETGSFNRPNGLGRNSYARRLSRLSNGIDANLELANRNNRTNASEPTLWEVP